MILLKPKRYKNRSDNASTVIERESTVFVCINIVVSNVMTNPPQRKNRKHLANLHELTEECLK
jgi:hypothetical protein